MELSLNHYFERTADRELSYVVNCPLVSGMSPNNTSREQASPVNESPVESHSSIKSVC